MEGLPLTALAVSVCRITCFGIAVPFHLFCAGHATTSVASSLSAGMGCVSRRDGLHGTIPYRGLSGNTKPHAAALRIEDGTHILDGQEYAPA